VDFNFITSAEFQSSNLQIFSDNNNSPFNQKQATSDATTEDGHSLLLSTTMLIVILAGNANRQEAPQPMDVPWSSSHNQHIICRIPIFKSTNFLRPQQPAHNHHKASQLFSRHNHFLFSFIQSTIQYRKLHMTRYGGWFGIGRIHRQGQEGCT
jgi:hypothetical protein